MACQPLQGLQSSAAAAHVMVNGEQWVGGRVRDGRPACCCKGCKAALQGSAAAGHLEKGRCGQWVGGSWPSPPVVAAGAARQRCSWACNGARGSGGRWEMGVLACPC